MKYKPLDCLAFGPGWKKSSIVLLDILMIFQPFVSRCSAVSNNCTYLILCTLARFSDLKWETSHYWWVFCVKYVQLFDTAEQHETKGWNIKYVQLFDNPEQRETNGWNIINMSKSRAVEISFLPKHVQLVPGKVPIYFCLK
jgi:hypothetical protein